MKVSMSSAKMKTIYEGNIYNKYESRNPLVMALMKKYFKDLDSLIKPIKGEINSAFEIGCGEGYVTQHIKSLGINVEGADISERIIKVARNLHPSIKFSIKSVYELSSYNECYDLVLAIEILEHLQYPKKAVEEMKKIVNKYFFFSVPNEPFFRLANVLRLKYLKDFGSTPGHINHWSKKSFRGFLEEQNFCIINIETSTLWSMALCKI